MKMIKKIIFVLGLSLIANAILYSLMYMEIMPLVLFVASIPKIFILVVIIVPLYSFIQMIDKIKEFFEGGRR